MKFRQSVLFIYNYMDRLGGVQRNISILSSEFKRRGLRISLLSSVAKERFVYEFGGQVFHVKKPSRRNPKSIRSKLVTRKIKKVLSDFNYVIDFRSGKDENDYILSIIKQLDLCGSTLIPVSHSSVESYLGGNYQALAALLKDFRSIVCLTEKMAEDVNRKYGLGNTSIIANAIDAQAIEEGLKASSDKLELPDQFILASGRLHDVKGFDLLIRAYKDSQLEKNKVKLLILGEGEKDLELKELTRKTGLDDLVEFRGFVRNPFVYSKHALFFVLSSRQEAFGNVLIENLYCGIPAVAFDCIAGPGNIIESGSNGLLIEPYDRNELFQYDSNQITRSEDVYNLRSKMNSLFDNPGLLSRLQKQAKISVEERFNLQRIADQWLDLLGH